MIKEENFLEAGFVKKDDPVFPYRKELVSTREMWVCDIFFYQDNDLENEDVPCLLFGNTGVNKGFCIYTGAHFVFFKASSPKEAVEWAEKMIAFESVKKSNK